MITSWFLIPFLCVGAQGLKCWEGRALDAVKENFTSTPCQPGETFCMEIHTKDEGKPTEDFKTCWDPAWDNGLYGASDYGCMSGQHCLGGVCYENATVCLCIKDDCNDFLADGSGVQPTAHPWVPSVPKDNHTCYYGSTDGDESSLDYVEVCSENENLCVKVTTDSANDTEADFQFRSCWSGSYAGEEFTRPGCYKGFEHCHITQAGEVCHNDTTICVCADKNCNSDKYSSAAPPYTPGSGLVCYVEDEHHHGPHDHGPHNQFDTQLCGKNETYCISAFDDSTDHPYSWRGCWSDDYEEGRYANFTGCETGQHCMFGSCRENTVCLCQGDLCNDYNVPGKNGTTPEPVPMTTTNMTNVCYYGMVDNVTSSTPWGSEACGPQETACMFLTEDSGFALASCYDFKYDDGKYNETASDGQYKCYDSGEHCWDNECHTGKLCLCQNVEPGVPCNNPVGPTPKPESTTPGSGLSCWYGDGVENSGQLKFNLTEQKCNVNETMCISVYGDEDLGDKVRHFFAQCHDPRYQDGRFNQSDMCIDGQYCHDCHHGDGCGDGPHLGRDDPPPACFNDNVCTCSTSLCNTYNVSSTDNPGTEPSTVASTPRCSFGEQHPGTGKEDWKVEVCQHNENYCYQMTTKEGFESRSCWDLAYEDDEYRDVGCYTGKHCHHEHCFDEATVCICSGPNCNEWTPNGTVTTDVPVTNPSSVLCYQGSYEHYLANPCPWNSTMCSYMLVDDGHELVDCFNPYSNNGTYYAEACYNNVDIEFHGHMRHGKLCVCDGVSNDLCNGEYFKNQDNGASGFLTGGLSCLLLASLIATLARL